MQSGDIEIDFSNLHAVKNQKPGHSVPTGGIPFKAKTAASSHRGHVSLTGRRHAAQPSEATDIGANAADHRIAKLLLP